ncbi:hypothetical protein JCM1840_000216 [Sporobolomyces johnsonii]
MAPSSSSVLGKPPVLSDLSPQALSNFLLAFELYFDLKSIDVDRKKIMMVGLSLRGFTELEAWWTASMVSHLAKTYETFIKELKREALPRDYVWQVEREIRENRQKGRDYGEWAGSLRIAQQSITTAAMSDRDFVKNLLYNMDEELSRYLRQHSVLSGTGLHEDDLDAIGISASTIPSAAATTLPSHQTAPSLYASTIDYGKFDRAARDQWDVIAARRVDVAKQVSAAKKPSTNSSTPAARTPVPTSSRSGNSAPAPATPATPGSAALTPLERAWLSATYGCTKCRLSWQDHRAAGCAAPISRERVAVPATFKPGDVVPPPAGFRPSASSFVPAPQSTTATTGAAAAGLRGLTLDDSESNSDETALEWTTGDEEDDECASELHLPPLSVAIGITGCAGQALADSGCSSAYISDRMVERLGLVRRRLKRARKATLAIKGGPEQIIVVSHYVRVPLEAKDSGVDFGETVLKIADLEPPYDLILGNPFLYRHRLSIHFYPYPRLLRAAAANEPEIDLLSPTSSVATLPKSRRLVASVLARVDAATNQAKGEAAQTREAAEMEKVKARLMEEFHDRFPDEIPPLAEADKSNVRHFIKLVDPSKVHNQRGYASPARWNERWKKLLDKHVDAGRLRLSRSPYASPSFVQPKKDPLADPRWLNDYRRLNENTVKDRTPLPIPDEILAQAAQARFWGKIDMSDAFFQTRVAEEDIEKTAIKMPWGLYEWVVMPQGLCNAPATHQRRMNEALSSQIGRICHAFVDDIIIWASSLEEHEKNVREVLAAIREAGLYCSPKKTDLVTIDTEFLGHRISRLGIAADPNKTARVSTWPTPRTAKQVRGFLGLVQYMRKFIPGLADHTAHLTPLTRKGLGDISALWGKKEEHAFQEIRRVVSSLPVLRPAVHEEGADPLWLMTDASKVGVGAVLLQGKDWKAAHPCGYYLRQYIAAEKNYPTHEQELLVVIAALKAFKIELLGEKFTVLTNHDTLRHLKTQPDLSKRQARWLETVADYDFQLLHVPGEKNSVADSLSRYSFPEEEPLAVMGISETSLSATVLTKVRRAYEGDSDAAKAREAAKTSGLFYEQDGLLFTDDSRLLIPSSPSLREALLFEAHDAAGHFGSLKTYSALARSFFWPGMGRDVKKYVGSCDGCQRMKSETRKKQGALHPLPVPSRLFSDIALDFVGPLPKSKGHDYLLTITDRLSGYTRLVGCTTKDDARTVAGLVYEHWVRFFGQPERMVSDRDKLFTSRFWKELHKRMGTKLQMSTAFHPETDGRSERTNKTAVQILRMMVSRRQTDWANHLVATEYAINAATNVATGKSPFELVLGYAPRLVPLPLSESTGIPSVEEVVASRSASLMEAKDALRWAKARLIEQTNKDRRPQEDVFEVGELVLVTSRDRRYRYKSSADPSRRSAKFFPRFDGPYPVIAAFPSQSLYQLQLAPNDKSFNKFHVSKLRRYTPNDADTFPSRQPPRPEPVVVGEEEEYRVEAIVDERKRGRAREFMVKWEGYPDAENTWEPLEHVRDTEAFGRWEGRAVGGGD